MFLSPLMCLYSVNLINKAQRAGTIVTMFVWKKDLAMTQQRESSVTRCRAMMPASQISQHQVQQATILSVAHLGI